MDFKKILWIFLVPSLLCGFKLIGSKYKWEINNSSTAKSKLFIEYDRATETLENDLPSDHSLAGTSTITVKQAIDSIIADYNSIQGAYLILADTADSDYAAEHTNRVIEVIDGTTDALATAGAAKWETDGYQIIGCKIVFEESMYTKANYFTYAVAHEIGHCLGLAHPQDTVNSIMSYFGKQDPRLQIDDKMGLVYLYPTDASKGQEYATMGFSCSRK